MKKTFIALFVLISVITFSQKKETIAESGDIDRAELERITRAINMSGESLRLSAQQDLNGWKLIGVGTLVSAAGILLKEPAVGYVGGGISAISIPFFISSIHNKRKAGERLMEFTLEAPLNIEPNSSWVINFDVDKLSEVRILNRQDFIGVPKALKIQYALTRALKNNSIVKKRNCTCKVLKQMNDTKTKFNYVITNCRDSKSKSLFTDNLKEVERTIDFDVE